MEPRKLLTLLMGRQNLNPNALAEKIKNATTQSQIHRFETGKTKEPKKATLKPVADFFGVPVEVFYSEDLAAMVAAGLAEGKAPAQMFPDKTLPIPQNYAPFLGGDLEGVTTHTAGSVKVPKAKPVEMAVLGIDAQRRLMRFLRALHRVPEHQQAQAIASATEVLLDFLPDPPSAEQ